MVDIRQIGRDLGVRYALEAQLFAGAGNRLRVTAQLIDATSAVMFGPSATIATSAISLRCRTEIATSVSRSGIEPALRPDAEQQRVLPQTAGTAGCVGGPTSEGYGTSTNTDRAKTRLRRPSFAEPSRSIRISRLAITDMHWLFNGRFGHYSRYRPSSRRFKSSRVRKVTLIAVSLDLTKTQWDTPVTGAHEDVGQRMAGGCDRRSPYRGRKLNPNGSFGISMLGYASLGGFGGYSSPGRRLVDCKCRAMRASPHDPLTSLWLLWIGIIQFNARQFAA